VAALGGVRPPNSGRGQPDVLAGNLAVQVKTRATLPAVLVAALDRAARDAAATGPDAVPVVLDLEAFAALSGRTMDGAECRDADTGLGGVVGDG